MAGELENLRAMCGVLKEPPDYVHGVVGGLNLLPDSIQLLHRYPGRRIYPTRKTSRSIIHERYTLTCNLHTEGSVCVNERTYTLSEGNATLTYPYQLHSYAVDQDNFDWLVITFLATAEIPAELMYRSTRMSETALHVLKRLLELFPEAERPDAPVALRHQMQHLTAALLGELLLEKEYLDVKRENSGQSPHILLFEQVNSDIFKHLADPSLSVKMLAERHLVSATALTQIFREITNLSPGRYIRELRIQVACKLLSAETVTIAEVAEQSGFSSLAVFSRSFHNETGMTPSEFIRRGRMRPEDSSI